MSIFEKRTARAMWQWLKYCAYWLMLSRHQWLEIMQRMGELEGVHHG